MMLNREEMLKALSDSAGSLSSKRVMTNRVVWTFIFSMLAMTVGISVRIMILPGDIGPWTVGAYTALTVPLSVAITVMYGKKEVVRGSTPDKET